jgi:hypothetical protein
MATNQTTKKVKGTIEYSTVKGDDIVSAMSSAGKSSVAERSMGKQDSVVWDQTVVAVMERIDLDEVSRDTSKEGIKVNGLIVKKLLSDHILSSGIEIPENGKNRQGQDFRVCGKDGVPQWSTWDQTRRIWDYAGTIAKVLAFSKESVLYPSQYKVGARCDVMALCKVAEEHMDAIKRQCTGLQNSLDSVANASEAKTATDLIGSLMVANMDTETELKGLIAALNAKLSTASPAIIAKLTPDMVSLATKYF